MTLVTNCTELFDADPIKKGPLKIVREGGVGNGTNQAPRLRSVEGEQKRDDCSRERHLKNK